MLPRPKALKVSTLVSCFSLILEKGSAARGTPNTRGTLPRDESRPFVRRHRTNKKTGSHPGSEHWVQVPPSLPHLAVCAGAKVGEFWGLKAPDTPHHLTIKVLPTLHYNLTSLSSQMLRFWLLKHTKEEESTFQPPEGSPSSN